MESLRSTAKFGIWLVLATGSNDIVSFMPWWGKVTVYVGLYSVTTWAWRI
jgi:hypothetical protein